jgi:hypothetical protein
MKRVTKNYRVSRGKIILCVIAFAVYHIFDIDIQPWIRIFDDRSQSLNF